MRGPPIYGGRKDYGHKHVTHKPSRRQIQTKLHVFGGIEQEKS
jgi:hypothetical protein